MTVTSEASKKSYDRPQLVEFGTVRNLTGGSLDDGQDAPFAAGKNANNGKGSDRRYKENIQRVDTHPAGFGLYLFDYKPEFRDAEGYGRQFGVMADEVEPIVPAAVARDASGYARVDYARLGITLN